MAYLFYNTKKYKDFSLEVDIKSPTDKRSSAWVGYDGEKGKTWLIPQDSIKPADARKNNHGQRGVSKC